MTSNAHAHRGPRPSRARRLRSASLCLALAAAGPVLGAAPLPLSTPGGDLTLGAWATLQLEVPRGPSPPPPTVGGSQTNTAAGSAHGEDYSLDNAQYTRRTRLSISHLAALAWWEPSPSWQWLAEVDGLNAAQWPRFDGGEDSPNSDFGLSLERLYVDYRPGDAWNLRLGKFLTPVGRWNANHADPLTWTTTRPLISQAAFPTNLVGAMAYGNLPLGSQGLDYRFYAAGRQHWDGTAPGSAITRAAGVRLAVPAGFGLQVGVSALAFAQLKSSPDHSRLVGADFVWHRGRAEFSGEALRRIGSDAGDGGERGWFVQGALPLAERWWLTTRWESYKRVADANATRSALVGLVFRSGGHWVAKVEWVRPTTAAPGMPQGLLASLTALF